MPNKPERTKVEVKESSTVDVRTFNITLTAPVIDFQLTDLLRQRGVINGLDVELKQAVKRAIENYLKTAETLISGLSSKASAVKKSRRDSTDHNQSSKSIPGNLITSKES